MRGVITAVKHSGKGFFFIEGEDGKRYFGHKKLLLKKNSYDKYVWNGNGCEFDGAFELEEGKSPTAVNIVPDYIADPRFAERKRLSKEHKEREEANAWKKAEKKRQQELIREEQERWKAFLKRHTWYVIQIREDGEWKDYMPAETLIIFKTVPEAREFIHKHKEYAPGDRLRIKTRETV